MKSLPGASIARLDFFRLGSTSISQQKSQRTNSEINAPEIRLVGDEGEQLGIMSSRQ
ncbi:hypothetical protein ABTC48_20060, partial [Acinetobacter baumannii]